MIDILFVNVMLSNDPQDIELSAQYLTEKYWATTWILLQACSKLVKLLAAIQGYNNPMVLIDYVY
jgi:hypothetical protein